MSYSRSDLDDFAPLGGSVYFSFPSSCLGTHIGAKLQLGNKNVYPECRL